jgi:heme oxygenase
VVGMSSWMLSRLSRATRDLADVADANRTSLLSLPMTRSIYVACLKQLYGFEAPIEAALARTTGLSKALDLRSRRHVRLLKADLAALGIYDTAELAVSSVDRFRSCSEALGWMYVVDRSAQLHGVLQRHMVTAVPNELANATSFLTNGGRSVRPRLEDLAVALDTVAQTPELADQVIDGARLAFAEQQAWFQPVAAQQQQQLPNCVA